MRTVSWYKIIASTIILSGLVILILGIVWTNNVCESDQIDCSKNENKCPDTCQGCFTPLEKICLTASPRRDKILMIIGGIITTIGTLALLTVIYIYSDTNDDFTAV